MSEYLLSLVGGALIGLSSAMLLILNGRIAGISGIVGRLAQGVNWQSNAAFLVGLAFGPVAYLTATGKWPEIFIREPLPVVIVAGLLVGFGTRMGSGCTSGHGVVGLARLSPRSLVAVVCFVTAGMLAITILRSLGV
jgi:uncharacterized membrane protein YedE/YeeE